MVSCVPFLLDDCSIKCHGVKSFSPSDTKTQIFKCAFVIESWGIETSSKTIEKEQSHDENMNFTVQKVVKYKEQRKCLIVSFIVFKFLIAS